MRAKDLAKLCLQCPDAEVVVTGPDHSYRLADVRLAEAEELTEGRRRFLCEYHGKQHMSDPENGKRIDVLVVR